MITKMFLVAGIYPGHLGPLGLAIPSCVCAMSTGDVSDHCWGRKGEFCVAVGPEDFAHTGLSCHLNFPCYIGAVIRPFVLARRA